MGEKEKSDSCISVRDDGSRKHLREKASPGDTEMPHTLYLSFRTQRKQVSLCDSFLNPLSFSSSQLWEIGSLISLFPQAYQANHVLISVSDPQHRVDVKGTGEPGNVLGVDGCSFPVPVSAP